MKFSRSLAGCTLISRKRNANIRAECYLGDRIEQNIENATRMNIRKTVDCHVHCFGINIEANEMRAVLSWGIWNKWVFIEDRTG